jgi:alkylation response protein AidB-like acyl-CoA dehydrogenase
MTTTGVDGDGTVPGRAGGGRGEPAVRGAYDRVGLDRVAGVIAERAGEHDRDGSFPHEAFAELAPTGVLSLTVPRALGGGSGELSDSVSVVETLGRADPSVALVVVWQLVFQAELARPGNRWPAEVRSGVQRSAADGVALINALRVEPELGTPARGGLPATVAARLPGEGGWSLSGRKTYCTGIPILRWLAVWARTDDAEPLVGAFLVEAGTPGYEVVETWDHIGLRASGSHDVVFGGTVIPKAQAVDVGPPDAPANPARALTLVWGNVLLAALYQGVALAARDWLVGYLNERTPSNLGAPLATLPRFQLEVGRIESLLRTNDVLVADLARRVDDGDVGPETLGDGPLVKHVVTANALQAVEIGLQLTGNPGLSRHNPLERHFRDSLTGRVHTPQSDTALAGAGRALLERWREAAAEGRP